MESKIGEAAGKIWQTLSSQGPMPKANLAKAAKLDKDLLEQGIGWLAREGKISLTDGGKKLAVKG
jgi:hypothetical protein